MRHALCLAQLLSEGRKVLVQSGSAALWSHLEDIMMRFENRQPLNEVTTCHLIQCTLLSAYSAHTQIEGELMRSQAFAGLARSLRGVEESVSTGGLTHKGSQQGIRCANNPKLSKLQDILLEHFRMTRESGNDDSRAIVFVALRTTVHDIVAELNHATGAT
jgi:ERCC4-related helicase